MQTAILALISAAVPMKTTAVATAAAILPFIPEPVFDPSPRQVEQARSVHVFGFTRQGALLLSESEGLFTQEDWDTVHDRAREVCTEKARRDGVDMVLDDTGHGQRNMAAFIRQEAEAKTDSDLHWK